MDLLALIASDPTVLPLWAVVLFAAGMYPVGMMFGCSACCGVCKSCCRDEAGQVVVDFSLEGTGPQTVKETPFNGFGSNGSLYTIDGTANIPMFILTGEDSGARVLVRAVNNYSGAYLPGPPFYGWSGTLDSRSPFLVQPIVRMGNQYLTDFIDGESVTVTPTPAADLIEEPSLTAVVGACEFNETLLIYQKPLTFSGNPGKWTPVDPPPEVDFTVDCQADEGTIVFDVAERDRKKPAFCDTCNIVVERLMPHPASFLLNPCSSGSNNLADVHSFAAETSAMSVSVPLSVFGSAECPDEITASATTSWSGFGGGFSKTDRYTIARAEQDCVPFESWPLDPADPPDGYVEQLVYLSATACFGSGFAGIATAPTGGPGDGGPITTVAVTEPGEGYAEIGRVEPSVTITGTGSGADLVVSLAQTNDACGRPRWQIASVSVGPGGGGSGYVDGEELVVTVDAPGIEEQAAAPVVVCGREEPSLAASFPLGGGTGADLTISLVPQTTPYANTWKVDEITVVDGGSGWTYGDYMTAVGVTEGDISVSSLDATILTAVSEPTITFGGGSGTGADLAASYSSNGTTYGPETWSIASIAINAGGTGYQSGDVLTIDLASGDVTLGSAYVTVSSVSGTGAITGLSIVNPGTFYHDSGIIESVVIDWAGAYYRTSDVIESVTFFEHSPRGLYYEEDATAPAIVSPVTINIQQRTPSAGTGADIEAIVDDDPESATFGQIIGLDIVDGGDDYLAVWTADGPCSPGGIYRGYVGYCGTTLGDEDVNRGGLLFTRGCPDYTYSVSIQGPA